MPALLHPYLRLASEDGSLGILGCDAAGTLCIRALPVGTAPPKFLPTTSVTYEELDERRVPMPHYTQALLVGERARKDDDLSNQAGHPIYTIETQTDNGDQTGNDRLGLTREDIQAVIFHARVHHVPDERYLPHQAVDGLINLVVSTVDDTILVFGQTIDGGIDSSEATFRQWAWDAYKTLIWGSRAQRDELFQQNTRSRIGGRETAYEFGNWSTEDIVRNFAILVRDSD